MTMRITKNEIPTKIDVPGAVVRQQVDFGATAGFTGLGAEYLTLGAGTDIAPLLQGLHDDACDSPHWGFLISGELVTSFTDGSQETSVSQDLFYWPPGHSVRVVADTELVMFSPQAEHTVVLDHMLARMSA